MRRLWLVRHGPTGGRGMCGWTDLPADLSDQAALNRLSLALPVAPVVSSDLVRAVATADAIAEDRPRLPHEPALREMHFGAWEMRRHDECAAEDPVLAHALWDDPGRHAPPGGESWDDMSGRVLGAMDRLLTATGGDLIAVCHFGPILACLQRARGIPAREAMGQRIAPLSLSVIRIEGGLWQVEAADLRP
ncbi:Fructose-2,6-bisphosphatase [Rubellimicrobium thermophilum DSM 16684]|uniref:Fructose-2,6-bisphosphatase n=1 Tax=Rubellimicrobium thermophilum DSM 16684 TaxID=1123069 RepID=S9QT89_9RHOB|nr:histidine phosphatase family protein [Rubellimicrobium thermophilum]EPX84551.1 Fructose-2,6-bisphosphatase [Rubellimicrobium thermophilum DSM 16684]